MDPSMTPINGISLERYAELGAAVADVTNDPAKEAEIIAQEGVSAGDWDAAKKGWTARMQDMALMGRVAMAYMPLYQAALAKKKGGQATASYEDFVAVSAAIKVFGFEVALKACGVSSSDWTEVAGHWNQTMSRDMMRYQGHPNFLGQEEARIRAGGEPKKVQITRVQGQIPATPAAGGNPYAGAMGVGGAQAQVPAHLQGNPMAEAMAAANAAAAPQIQAQMAAQQQIAANPLGFGLGQAAAYMGLSDGLVAGNAVHVMWSDGRQYPARVMQVAPQQILVQFENGSQQWVPPNAVRKA